MSKRKIAYARKTCIDPEEEGETLPFEPREIVIHKDYWFDRDYDLCDELLGRGKFGEVKKCMEKSTGLMLAAKIVTARTESNREDVRKEIRIMSQLRHPKILQIYDAFETRRKMCLITELVEGGELFDRIVDPHFDLTERVAILFMRQIVDAIAFIHSQNILHLDMKPENIICMAKTGTRIKIIDFGLAMRFDSFTSSKVIAGTIDFMSPEVCNYEDVTPATDMWSIGVICYVLVSGLSPFCGDDDADTICNVLRVEFDFAAEEFDEITAGCKDFIKKLLIKDPRKRMTADECLKHSWLNKITRSQTKKHLSKKHHIKFFIRRKWKKVIKAVIALNRMKILVRQRHERELEADSRDDAELDKVQEVEKMSELDSLPAYLPEWRRQIEAKRREREANRGDTTSVMLAGTARRCRVKSSKSEGTSSITPSLSCSSGYESSGSTKFVVDDDTLLGEEQDQEELEDDIKKIANGKNHIENSDDEEDECKTPVLETKEFFRLESNDTLVDIDQSNESKNTEWDENAASKENVDTDYLDGCRSFQGPSELSNESISEENISNVQNFAVNTNTGLDGIMQTYTEAVRKAPSNKQSPEGKDQSVSDGLTGNGAVEALSEKYHQEPHTKTESDLYEMGSENSHGISADNADEDYRPLKDVPDENDDLISDCESHCSSRSSSTQHYCPMDTLDNIVSAIARNSSSCSDHSSKRSNNASISSSRRGSYVSVASNSSGAQQKPLRKRSSSIILTKNREKTDAEEMPACQSNIGSMRNEPSNGVMDGKNVDFDSVDDSVCKAYRSQSSLPLGGRQKNSDDSLMTSSFSGVLSSAPEQETARPTTSVSQYNSNDSLQSFGSQHIGDESTDENKFSRRMRSPRISPSPVREINTTERRRARIAAICGDEYLPPLPPTPPLSYLMERVIPIEVEGFSPCDWNSKRSSSDSYPNRASQPIRGRVSQSPLRGDNYYTRISPAREVNQDLAQRSSLNSVDRRKARINAIIGEGNSNSPPRSPAQRSSAGIPPKSTSRLNSDEARHRRIAAVLCNANDIN